MPEHDYSNVDWKTLVGKECTFIGNNGRRITFLVEDWDGCGHEAIQLWGKDHMVRSDRSRLVRIHGDGPAGVAAVVPEPTPTPSDDASLLLGLRPFSLEEAIARYNEINDRLSQGVFA